MKGLSAATGRRASSSAQDNKIIFTATGNDGWKTKMWPKIVEVTGTKA